MNCTECKELLVAYVEGLLDESQKPAVIEHLKSCQSCRTQSEAASALHDRLVANGKVLARADLENNVMNRIVREQNVRLKTANKVSTTIRIRRILMKNPIAKLAVAAVLVAAVLIGVHFIGNPLGANITFAKVIQPILNARTVVFDFVVGGEEAGSVMHDIVVGSKIRRTFSNMDPIMIIDLDSAKMLTLDPKSKGAAYVDIQGPLQEGTKNLLEFVRKVITSLKDLSVQELGQRDIDGRKALGFYAAEKPNIELTIWADPETAKPIRIELLMGQSLYILKNFEFDVPVDDSLVSMEPPAGYTLSDKQFNMTQFTEQDFITVLRLWVEHLLGGNFPQNLSAGELMSLAPQLAEKIGQLNVSEEEKTQLGMTMGKGLVFFQQLDPTGVTWHYTGSGVKLGDAGKAVFWYQPKGSQTYRVIYGDLSVKDVAPENLPK
jgi:outer membrane lipoprotein-sorting protein